MFTLQVLYKGSSLRVVWRCVLRVYIMTKRQTTLIEITAKRPCPSSGTIPVIFKNTGGMSADTLSTPLFGCIVTAMKGVYPSPTHGPSLELFSHQTRRTDVCNMFDPTTTLPGHPRHPRRSSTVCSPIVISRATCGVESGTSRACHALRRDRARRARDPRALGARVRVHRARAVTPSTKNERRVVSPAKDPMTKASSWAVINA